MIPIHLLTNGAAPAPPAHDGLPAGQAGICYLVAKSGIYKHVENPFYSARVKVSGIGHLEDTAELVRFHVPKLPLALLRQAESFFQAVYDEHQSEAVVVLLANPASKEWRIEVPAQDVNGGLHVSYDPTSVAVPKGFCVFGTIHSHASAGAFHSATDDKDECCSDGLHITIGNLDRPARSYSARWMICGVEYPAKLEEVVDSPPLPLADPAWLERVKFDQGQAFDGPFGGSLLETSVGQAIGRAARDPDMPPEIPSELAEDYEYFMAEAHERFVEDFLDR